MKNTYRVLVSCPYMQPPVIDAYRDMLAAHGVELVFPPVRERLEEDELIEWIGDIDGVISGDDRFTERVFDAAPRLKVISKWGVGVDSIDRDAAAKRGIAVRNSPGLLTDPVADTVFAFMLCFARRIPWVDRHLRSGAWRKEPGFALHECVLGVIGVGRIGRAIIRRAVAFGMTVLGNDIVEIPAEFAATTGLEVVDRDALLQRADFVSLNCDLNPTSLHLLSHAEFALMKPGACLLNTARGPIVDEPALVKALQEKQIAGAGLDVFEDEPLPATSPLLKLDNVLLCPHMANASPSAWQALHDNTVRNLLEGLASGDRESLRFQPPHKQ